MRSVEVTAGSQDHLMEMAFKRDDGATVSYTTVSIDNEDSDDILAFIWNWNDNANLPEPLEQRMTVINAK